MITQTDIAIIGMSCIFPGAGDIHSFWNNILQKKDAIQAVPENRMESTLFDPGSGAVDRFYCRRGGFIDEFALFDPLAFGILPVAVEGTEPEQLLALQLAQQALKDAGVLTNDQTLDRTGIIIGKGNYTGPGATRAIEIVRTGEQIVQVLQNLLPGLTRTELEKVKKEFQGQKGRFGADTAMGLIPNLVASLIANRLNLGGTAYTVDAACASSLIAVDHAVQELRLHRADMVLAGGVHICQNAPFWSIFTQLGALSRKEQIRPFDRRADGLLIGEGCGFVVLKRLEDALRDQHRIYAVLKGTGIASDGAGTSVMSPSVKGQSNAIRQAWQNAGLDTSQIGYIEAHGTGTPLGDKTELATLAAVFGKDLRLPKAGIGTIKSMIGHAMPAAGMAGLIKMALALYHAKLPPTLHCEEPLDSMHETRFVPVQEARDWDDMELPKRAGINAFGFGGINAHVVLEGLQGKATATGKRSLRHKPVVKTPLLILARPDLPSLIKALEENDTTAGEGRYRIALFDPTPERIKKAIKIVSKNIPWRNRQDIWFTNDPLITKGGKIAFLFPGLDGLLGGEVDSVADYFNLPRIFSTNPHNEKSDAVVFSSARQLLEKSRIIDNALKQLGVWPDMNAGHSLGEWLAGRSAGIAEEASVTTLMEELNPASFEQKNAVFLAAGCGYEQLAPILATMKEKEIYLSMDNCPQQVILCGTQAAIEEFSSILREKQIFHQQLPFQSGFHSPFAASKLDLLLSGINKVKFQTPSIPVWSATTLALYPDNFEAIRELSIAHLIQPVRFRELTEKLYNEGVRVFIQVGSGGITGFVDDTLKNKMYSAIAANVPARPGLDQLQRVLAALYVEGREVSLSFLGIEQEGEKKGGAPMKLQLGSPLVKKLASLKELPVHTTLPDKAGIPVYETTDAPVMKQFMENSKEIIAIQEEILALFHEGGRMNRTVAVPTVPGERDPINKQLDISLENTPYLIDHSLLRQKPGWRCADDMDPVIPMTMILELMGETAQENAPGKKVKKISQVAVFQWMNVATPFRETITGKWLDENRLALTLEKYATAEVQLSGHYELPGISHLETGSPLHFDLTPSAIYERNMFHGPAYQGIQEITAFGEEGIRGVIKGSTGKGSLLDNAGQLFGLWLQLVLQKDRIAFPVKIQEVAFYDDMQDQQGNFECTCRLTHLNEEFATADFILKRAGRVWAVITGWQNRRLEIDEALWRVSMAPTHHLLSDEIAPGIFVFRNAYQRVVSWDFITKRYFNQPERSMLHALPPQKKKEKIISRVAAKDAIRSLIGKEKKEFYYPIEFEIRSDEAGRPFPYGDMTAGIHISLSHKNNYSVATARYQVPVGIDMEEIKEQTEGFKELVFTPGELALIAEWDAAEWVTRCWVAKEAYGKYLGKGLQGNPRAYVIHSIQGEKIQITEITIQTIKYNNYIIGWTL